MEALRSLIRENEPGLRKAPSRLHFKNAEIILAKYAILAAFF